jgi:hypothetical protein
MLFGYNNVGGLGAAFLCLGAPKQLRVGFNLAVRPRERGDAIGVDHGDVSLALLNDFEGSPVSATKRDLAASRYDVDLIFRRSFDDQSAEEAQARPGQLASQTVDACGYSAFRPRAKVRYWDEQQWRQPTLSGP